MERSIQLKLPRPCELKGLHLRGLDVIALIADTTEGDDSRLPA
jgi:hypothetical protein